MVLVPESRPDKNGKVVVRHVRQDKNPTSPKPSMPAPEIFKEASQKLSQQLGMAVSDIGMSGYGMSLAEVMQLARRAPAETAEALIAARSYAIPSSAFDFLLVTALREKVDPERLENIALLYSDDQYYDFFNDNGSEETYRVVTEDIRGLAYYPQLGGTTNFYRADKETQKKAIALVSIMQEADNHGSIKTITEPDGLRSAVLKDERLVQLAVDNANNLRVFLDLVRERGCNVDVLVEGLKTTQPLRQGVL